LSLHLKKAVEDGQFQALIIGENIKISHNFFVDDVLILGMLNRFTWLTLFHILKTNSNATSLHMNLHKLIVYHDMCDTKVIDYIKGLFGIETEPMKFGMKYLGYHIKPCSYRNAD